MKSAIHCQVLLPGILPGKLQAPSALQTWLRFARHEPAIASADAWLCQQFGVARQQDWPLAPFACLAEDMQAEAGYWLCATPAHLVLQRDSFALADAALDLPQAQALVQALNAHFSPDGLHFHAPHAQRWYLHLPQAPQLQTVPYAQALGRDIQPLLPRGGDALHWHRWLNELQMLLHAHPVNQAREEAGQLPINSVWLWGGGELPSGTPREDIAVHADDPAVRGLAKAHGCSWAPLPAAARDWRAAAASQQLIVLNPLDLSDPQAALENLDAQWLAPLLAELRAGRIARLSLWLEGTHDLRGFTLARGDLYRFWRRASTLKAALG